MTEENGFHVFTEPFNGGYDNESLNPLLTDITVDAYEITPERFTAETGENTAENPPAIHTKSLCKVLFPLDKVSSLVWDSQSINAYADENGLLHLSAEKKGSKKEATITCGIFFDELEEWEQQGVVKITKQLTHYDMRVYIAADALYGQNGECMSLGQIHYAMGNTSKPSKNQLQKINDSLTKMGTARLYLNNNDEIIVNKGYPKFVHDGALLPFERISAYVNNALCDSAIRLLRDPPLMAFAKGRKQVTSIPRKLLESPISKTEGNLQIEHYLIDRIARMKNGRNSNHKILYQTIYERCNITTRLQRSRTPEKIRRILGHYKDEKYIKGYTEEADSITIRP